MPKKKQSPPPEPTRVEFETFRKLGAWEQSNLHQGEPSCFNDVVSIRKYRVIVEPVDEPNEVLIERLKKLWWESDSHHHRKPLRRAAEEIGYELPSEEFGKDAKRR